KFTADPKDPAQITTARQALFNKTQQANLKEFTSKLSGKIQELETLRNEIDTKFKEIPSQARDQLKAYLGQVIGRLYEIKADDLDNPTFAQQRYFQEAESFQASISKVLAEAAGLK